MWYVCVYACVSVSVMCVLCVCAVCGGVYGVCVCDYVFSTGHYEDEHLLKHGFGMTGIHVHVQYNYSLIFFCKIL